jgi:hypothetical protein
MHSPADSAAVLRLFIFHPVVFLSQLKPFPEQKGQILAFLGCAGRSLTDNAVQRVL